MQKYKKGDEQEKIEKRGRSFENVPVFS